jgi:hypothetical protein
MKIEAQVEFSNSQRLLEAIPRSGGFNTPQLAAESVSKDYFVVHTRDFAFA